MTDREVGADGTRAGGSVDRRRNVFIAVPAYNEASSIGRVVEECSSLDGCRVHVFIDGSTDGTVDIVRGLGVGFHHEVRNKGLARTFSIVLEHFLRSDCDYLMIVDGDGQYDAKQVDAVISTAYETRMDVVIGSRFLGAVSTAAVPRVRRVVNQRLAAVVSWVVGLKRAGREGQRPLTDVTSGLRAYSRQAALAIPPMTGHSYTLPSLAALCQMRLGIVETPVHATYHAERDSAISGSYRKYGRYLISSLSRSILVAGYQRLLPIFVFGQLLAAVIGVTFLGLSWHSGAFRGWLFLVGIAAFVSITCTALFAAYFAVVQGVRTEHRVFSLQRDLQRLLPVAEPCPDCWSCPST